MIMPRPVPGTGLNSLIKPSGCWVTIARRPSAPTGRSSGRWKTAASIELWRSRRTSSCPPTNRRANAAGKSGNCNGFTSASIPSNSFGTLTGEKKKSTSKDSLRFENPTAKIYTSTTQNQRRGRPDCHRSQLGNPMGNTRFGATRQLSHPPRVTVAFGSLRPREFRMKNPPPSRGDAADARIWISSSHGYSRL